MGIRWITVVAFTVLSVQVSSAKEGMRQNCEALVAKSASPCISDAFKKNCPDEYSQKCSSGAPAEAQPESQPAVETPEEEKTTKAKKPTTKKPKPAPAQAAAARHCDRVSPCIPMPDANARFNQRCQQAVAAGALPPACPNHCRYDEDTQSLKKAFLGSDCQLKNLRPYLVAASNGRDNSGCCTATGVTSQSKTAVCGCFCFPTGPVWPAPKGETKKYAPCVSVLEAIMRCHYFAEGADD